jgi:transposase
MKDFLIAGVDVSKATLDIYFKPMGTLLHIENKLSGFKHLYKTLTDLCSQEMKTLVILEHTGRYSDRFERFMRSKGIEFCKIPALQIKRSLGVLRGKNDEIDAQRIAEYGWLRRDVLIPDVAVAEEIQELKQLLSLRSKLVRDRSGYHCRLKEVKATKTSSMGFELKLLQQTISFLTSRIQETEMRIKKLVTSNPALCRTNDLLRSIKGVGWIVACYMITCTANFTRFKNPRKFNCYAGLAPFKHESGSSIKGRARVSHLANKEIKSILNLAATCAMRFDPELKQYYQRRVNEGKRKMSCINIIRSKIVGRMFAIIKRQSPFVPLIQVA